MQEYLLDLLLDLDSVPQHPQYHPEGDALYHSLQVFQHSIKLSSDPQLWAAALFHDIGKAVDGPTHAMLGAKMLEGILHTNICWLISHHLDLLVCPKKTQRKYSGTQKLEQLRMLRDCDLKGRDPYAEVCSPEYAVSFVLNHYPKITA